MSLSVTGVSHRYGKRAALVLRDITLEIADGDAVALVGPSGSGKTTLLAVLGLLLRPTSGSVSIDGTPIPERRTAASRANAYGWVFQGSNVLPRRSASENAALGALARGESRSRALQQAAAALDAVGIGGLAEQRANLLSGGELQRVCIARAIASRPRFILADEPTGQLDSATTESVIAALVVQRGSGTTLVVATHDMAVAERCARVVRLRDGAIVEGMT